MSSITRPLHAVAHLRAVIVGIAALMAVLAVAAPAMAAEDRYVALGDSYSSGAGTRSYTLDSGCQRGVTPTRTCSPRRGRTRTDVRGVQRRDDDDVMSTQIASVTSTTAFVSVSIGGNDAGFSASSPSARSPRG